MSSKPSQNNSYTEVFREIGGGLKDVAKGELDLFVAEVRSVVPDLKRHLVQTAVFGFLLAVSILPFLAFLIIGIGDLLDGRYWLSSLIVSIVCAGVGGFFAYRASRKIKEQDLNFDQSLRSLHETKIKTQSKMEDIKETVKGDRYGKSATY